MNIVGLLRVKNEARWIGEVIASINRLCSAVYVFDDHSTDATPIIARNSGAIVLNSLFSDFNEARDKDALLDYVAHVQREPDTWCLMIDGDEVLDVGSRWFIDTAIQTGEHPAYSLPVLYLWNDRRTVRVDGAYAGMKQFGRPSLFKLDPAAMTFATGVAAGNMHCSNVPAAYLGRATVLEGARLLHLGYMDRADRIRKYEWYRQRDGANQAEDGYRHMVIGDLFPPSSQFKHGGPIQLEALA